MGANAVNLVRIMEGRDQPRALGAARRTRLGSSPYRRGDAVRYYILKTCLMSLGSQEVASASVRKRDPPPTPLHLHRVCFVRGIATIVRRGLLIENSLQLTIHEK